MGVTVKLRLASCVFLERQDGNYSYKSALRGDVACVSAVNHLLHSERRIPLIDSPFREKPKFLATARKLYERRAYSVYIGLTKISGQGNPGRK